MITTTRTSPEWELARADWAASGLTDDQAAMLHFKPVSEEEAAKILPGFGSPGYVLPYFDEHGKPTTFFRMKRLGKPNGFTAFLEKPPKYKQPAGVMPEVYFAPLLGRTWAEILADEKVPLVITEGEKKGAAGCTAGTPTIALGGVSVYRSARLGLDLLPQLKRIKWSGRRVTVVFDSDTAHNPNVLRAQNCIAAELAALGAVVWFAPVPPGPEGEKQGLDDLLVVASQGGGDRRAAYDAHLATALPYGEGSRLHEMNEEVAYIRDPGMIVERATGRRMSPANFKEHAYSNRHFMAVKATASGPVQEKKKLAPRWLEWEARAEFSGVTYDPGSGRIIGEGHAAAWNTWDGWGVEPMEGSVEPWTALLDHLFAGYPSERAYFEKWCAYPIQFPGVKMYVATVLWGVTKGTGKSLIGETLADIYGREKNSAIIKNEQLMAGFNAGWAGRQFVVGDEITGSESRALADKLKVLITQDRFAVNQKYLPVYTVRDCCNYTFNSNHPDAFYLDAAERRYFIFEVQGAPLPGSFFDAFRRWRLEEGGVAHLHHHLRNLDLSGFDPRARAPDTEAKEDMVEAGQTASDRFATLLARCPDEVLPDTDEFRRCPVFTVRQLLFAFDQWAGDRRTGHLGEKGLGISLTKAGVEKKRDALGMIYIVRDAPKWLAVQPSELRAANLAHFPKPRRPKHV